MSCHANYTRLLTALTVFALLFAARPANGAPADVVIHGSVPSYKDAPVFYDFFWSYYADMENLNLMHEGKVKLGKLGIQPIDDFNWEIRPGQNNSYWIRMENFWYLTPLMHSGAERDKAFVRDWFERWIAAHDNKRWNNYGAKDAMSAGFRAMTFIWYLRLLHQQGETNSAWCKQIQNVVKEHQDYLSGKFFAVSNHGFWEAMGLFETARVYADSAKVHLALDRLNQMVSAGITGKGFYIERAPFYQTEVFSWITHYVEYFRTLKGFEWSGFAKLEAAQRNMSEAIYYLFDHAGNVPQIGDTDAQRFSRRRPRSTRRANMPETFVDKRAGYAIYKDAEARRGRYVVFTVPNMEYPNKMPYHNHNDLLAVYYSHRGEIILGDQGRFSYGKDSNRRYFQSALAHNTILPRARFVKSGGGAAARRAKEVLVLEEKDFHLFSASLREDKVTRVVRVPKNDVKVEVLDTILDNEPYVVLWHMGADVESIRPIDAGGARGITPDGQVEFSFELTTRKRRHYLLTISTNAGPPESDEWIKVVSGIESPMLGWYSPGHHQKVPVPVIKLTLDVRNFANVATIITPLGY